MSKISRVLLVEDEEDAKEVLSFYLKTIFEQIDTASNGEEGLNKFLENKQKNIFYDLIITDIKMPKVDGLSMLEQISKLYKEQKFIVISAYKDEEYLFRSINLNVISYFVKPLQVEKLMELLGQFKSSLVEDNKIQINKTYSYNKEKKLLYEHDQLLNLSKKETLLLDILLSKKGEILTTTTLKKEIWEDENISDATLRTLFKRLKDKILKEDFVVSKKGLGYIIL